MKGNSERAKGVRVTREEMIILRARIREINSIDLSEVVTDIEMSKIFLEDVRFTGLDNFLILEMAMGGDKSEE